MTEVRRREAAAAVARGQDPKTVAAERGVSVTYVYAACRAAGIEVRTVTPWGRQMIPMKTWEAADWSLRDKDIAAVLGVTRERVRQVRRILGKPNSTNHRRHEAGLRLEAWLKSNANILPNLSLTQITDSYPGKTAASEVLRVCHRLGLKYGRVQGLHSIVNRENLAAFVSVTAGGCWEWRDGRIANDYGSISGPERYAHRFVWSLFNGPIPEGRWVLHSCDNPCCVNPDHLHLGDASDNAREMTQRGRRKPPTPLEAVAEIRRRFAAGESPDSLAREFDRTHSTILNIVKGRTRGEVPSVN